MEHTMSAWVHDAALLALVVMTILAAAQDVKAYQIADRWPLAIAALFPVAALAAGVPLMGWLAHGGVALAVFTGGAVLFRLGGMGGGDVKLLTALALWAGPPAVLLLLTGTALGGGLLAGAVLLRRALRLVPATTAPSPTHLPYAAAMLPGVGLAMLAPHGGAAAPSLLFFLIGAF